ncbi:membrane alanine aminopeptidase N [Vibrio astriarenae]|nr:membrane alanine aminopeptidase N [Vibrio sp. C7]
MTQQATTQPVAKYRKDYQSPSHTTSDIELYFELHDTATVVTATSQVKQLKDSTTLELDGEQLGLQTLQVNGQDWTEYELLENGLTIHQLPEQFELKIVTQINPEANTALEGLYKSGGAFCTQCEAEASAALLFIKTGLMC